MLVFLDFEASSLAKKSYPIEVGWVFEDGRSEAYLIKPAPTWIDWDPQAEAIHHITRETLVAKGTPHEQVAHRMVAELVGHDLLASAPSWDGKWLSALLRAAGLERHTLRLRDSDAAHAECARAILAPLVPSDQLDATIENLLKMTEVRAPGYVPAHRALPDAEEERQRWLAVRAAARTLASKHRHAAETADRYPTTPDGRYFVVRGRLWRKSDPALDAATRAALVARLMNARRAVAAALRSDDVAAETAARSAVDAAKRALGERGPVWWDDGAPDLNRHMARTTPYAAWFESLT
jgi:hypothetical protein